MKTTFRYLSLNAQATWHRQVEEQLEHLHSLTAITSADVVLEHQREAKPAFRVQVRLEVPGPGMHAKATRHARQAAPRPETTRSKRRCSRRPRTWSTRFRSANSGAWNGAKANFNSAPFPAGGPTLRPAKGEAVKSRYEAEHGTCQEKL
jgi:hypothetical protein